MGPAAIVPAVCVGELLVGGLAEGAAVYAGTKIAEKVFSKECRFCGREHDGNRKYCSNRRCRAPIKGYD